MRNQLFCRLRWRRPHRRCARIHRRTRRQIWPYPPGKTI